MEKYKLIISCYKTNLTIYEKLCRKNLYYFIIYDFKIIKDILYVILLYIILIQKIFYTTFVR